MKKKKMMFFFLTLCCIFSLIGCGKKSDVKVAEDYYENTLGMEHAEAEELAQDLFGKPEKSEHTIADSGEEKGIDAVEILPEIANGEWSDLKVQVLDMVFTVDLTMTYEDVEKTVENSAYDIETDFSFDSEGNPVLSGLKYNGEHLCGFSFVEFYDTKDKFPLNNEFKESGKYLKFVSVYPADILKGGIVYSCDRTDYYSLETIDDVLDFLQEKGFVEAERSPYSYNGRLGDSDKSKPEVTLYKDKIEENELYMGKIEENALLFLDSPHYVQNGRQSILVYEVSMLTEPINGSYFNAVEAFCINFNPDGTLRSVNEATVGGKNCAIILDQYRRMVSNEEAGTWISYCLVAVHPDEETVKNAKKD